jgi:hypothetical protein
LEEVEEEPKDGVVEPKEKEGVPFDFDCSEVAEVEVPNAPKVFAESVGVLELEDEGVLRAAKGFEEAPNDPANAEGFCSVTDESVLPVLQW